jgi:hypothetical protein
MADRRCDKAEKIASDLPHTQKKIILPRIGTVKSLNLRADPPWGYIPVLANRGIGVLFATTDCEKSSTSHFIIDRPPAFNAPFIFDARLDRCKTNICGRLCTVGLNYTSICLSLSNYLVTLYL